jgi:lysophospholipase L1-like esterase
MILKMSSFTMKKISFKIKTLLNILILAFLFVFIISCAKKNNTPTDNNNRLDTSKTYLALGDSYTIGESVAVSGRYPVQTINLLRQQNIKINDPDIIAVTGWTTTDLINALNSNPPKNHYTIVSLLIGVNNQYQHRTLEEYKTEFTELLNRSIAYTGNNRNHVFVLSIPDYSVTPFAAGLDTTKIASEINEFNNANKTISINAGVHYLDITFVSREAKNNLLFTTDDGLHPSAYQYEQWSALLAPMMQQELH